ncbi:hypothetical protein [Streptomyces sp. NPDC002491]
MRQSIVRTEQIAIACDLVNGWTVVEVDGELDIHTQRLDTPGSHPASR